MGNIEVDKKTIYTTRQLVIHYAETKGEMVQLDDPAAVYKFLKPKLQFQPEEVFIVVALNKDNGIAGWRETARGTASDTIIHPREIFKFVYLCNATGFILAHNHPSGECKPSDDDIVTTAKVAELADIHLLNFLDHIIIGYKNYFSMKAGGYIK